MMTGLQGAGKTTTAAKLAGKFKQKGKKVLLVAGDVYRPAAIEQLQINGQKQGVEVFSMGDKNSPVNIAKAAMEHAAKNDFNIVIIDTAGRLHIYDGRVDSDKRKCHSASDRPCGGRHDRTGCGECGEDL